MSQEDIDATKAPLMDHIIELRGRLIRSIYAFFAAFLVCFYFSRTIYNILTEPYVRVVGAEKATLIATHFLEQFYTNVRLSMFGAGVIAFPVIATQIYKFVAPGLYKHERSAFRPYLIATPIFFMMGAGLVEGWVGDDGDAVNFEQCGRTADQGNGERHDQLLLI